LFQKNANPKTLAIARFRPPEAWRSPGPVSTWGVWRPLCAKLGGNPAGSQRKTILRKPIRLVEIYRKSVWTKMERQNMPTNFAQKIWSTLVQTTPNQ